MTRVSHQQPVATLIETDKSEKTHSEKLAHLRGKVRITHRRGVRFAHAYHAHRLTSLHSTKASQLVKALAKNHINRTGKTFSSKTSHASLDGKRATVTHDVHGHRRDYQHGKDGNQGERGDDTGGDASPQQQQQQERDNPPQPFSEALANGSAGDSWRNAHILSSRLFASELFLLEGDARLDALATAWCTALLLPDHVTQRTAEQHNASRQLRVIRQQEGPLPLTTLNTVRRALEHCVIHAASERTAEPAADDAQLFRSRETNLLIPLRALAAGRPVLQKAEERGSNITTSCEVGARDRSTSKKLKTRTISTSR